jgi:uncharacterized protein
VAETGRGKTIRREGGSSIRTIGVISDTHGLLRPEAVTALQGCALILHAGDVGDAAILARLGEIAPVHAVFGNTDGAELKSMLPATAVVDLGSEDGSISGTEPVGPLAYILHGDANLDVDPAAAGIAMVVSGHTHQPLVEHRGGVLYVNPGSAGPRRFRLPVTVARVRVEADRALEAVIVELDIE